MAHSTYAGAQPSHCTWKVGTTEPSPHVHQPTKRNDKILDSIIEHIGNTPVVRINRIGKTEGVKCDLGTMPFRTSFRLVSPRLSARAPPVSFALPF